MFSSLVRKVPKVFQSRRFAVSLMAVIGFLEFSRIIYTNVDTNNNGVARTGDGDRNRDDDVEKWINEAKQEPPDGQAPDDDDDEVLNWVAQPTFHIINEGNSQEDEEREDDNQIMDQNNQPNSVKKKILLLAYARSGSSFAGDLLSASRGASYFFEPLYSLKPNGFSIERVLAEDPSKVNLVESYMNGIFNCNQRFLSKIHRKRGMKCSSSNLRVAKTIRLHRVGLEPWIYDSDIKIVHLIRDPRGIISSMAKKPATWGETSRNPAFLCNKMMEDLKISQKLPKHRYIRVKYEDLASNSYSALQDVYKMMEVPFNDQVAKEVWRHTHGGNETIKGGNNKYYSTYRNKNFNHNSWQKTLGMKAIRNIEKSCETVLKMTGYQVYNPTIKQ